MSSDSSAQCAR